MADRIRIAGNNIDISYRLRNIKKKPEIDRVFLRELCEGCGIEVGVVPAVCVDGEVVSSTRIRELLSRGEDVARFF